MQLRMTAPMDIGMEQADAALGGQDDIFDLDEGSKALRGKRAAAGLDDESEFESDEGEGEDEDEALDSEEERERKLAGLEAELDGMYDAYQEHLKERDAKYKVKEALKNNKAREAWHGIGQGGDSDADSDVEEGGYEKVQRAKARIGENDSDSSDDSSDDDEAEPEPVAGKKRRRAEAADSGLKSKKARTVAEVEEQKAGPSLSRSAQMWFGQDMFAGLDAEVDDDEEEDDEDMEGSEVEDEEDDESENGDEDEVRISTLGLQVKFEADN